MLNHFSDFLDALGNQEYGVMSVLTPSSFEHLTLMVGSVYGEHAKSIFSDLFTQIGDGSIACRRHNAGQVFREGLSFRTAQDICINIKRQQTNRLSEYEANGGEDPSYLEGVIEGVEKCLRILRKDDEKANQD